MFAERNYGGLNLIWSYFMTILDLFNSKTFVSGEDLKTQTPPKYHYDWGCLIFHHHRRDFLWSFTVGGRAWDALENWLERQSCTAENNIGSNLYTGGDPTYPAVMPYRLKTKSSFLFTLRLPLPRSHRHPTPSPLSLPPHLPPFLHFMLLPSNSTFLPFQSASPLLQFLTLPLSHPSPNVQHPPLTPPSQRSFPSIWLWIPHSLNFPRRFPFLYHSSLTPVPLQVHPSTVIYRIDKSNKQRRVLPVIKKDVAFWETQKRITLYFTDIALDKPTLWLC